MCDSLACEVGDLVGVATFRVHCPLYARALGIREVGQESGASHCEPLASACTSFSGDHDNFREAFQWHSRYAVGLITRKHTHSS